MATAATGGGQTGGGTTGGETGTGTVDRKLAQVVINKKRHESYVEIKDKNVTSSACLYVFFFGLLLNRN